MQNGPPSETVTSMETRTPQKLYAYVDESGQYTEGRFFVVSVVLLGTDRDTVLARLEALEDRSRKGRVKWRRARYAFRQDYIAGLLDMPLLVESIFVTTFRQGRNYFELTVESTARAITAKTQGRPYRVTIFVDGLTRPKGDLYQPITGHAGLHGRKCAGSAMSRAMPWCDWRTRSAD